MGIGELKTIEYYLDDAINMFGTEMTLGEARSKLVSELAELGYYVYPEDNKGE